MECARNVLKEFFRLVNCSLIAGSLSHIHPPPPCSPCQQWNDGHSQDNFHFSKVISWSTIAISRCLSRALSARSEKLRLVILINFKRTKGRLLLCKCTLKIMPAADIFFVQELICICLFFFLNCIQPWIHRRGERGDSCISYFSNFQYEESWNKPIISNIFVKEY